MVLVGLNELLWGEDFDAGEKEFATIEVAEVIGNDRFGSPGHCEFDQVVIPLIW
jgi:hypothetical protein